MKRVFTILLLTLLLFCGAGAAAETTFSVVVFDSTAENSPMEGATVTLSSGSVSRTLLTTSSGTAEFSEIQTKADYTITVSKSGYVTQKKSVYVSEANQREPIYLSAETPILITVTDNGKAVADASVTINNKAAGKTDSYGRLHASMIRGAYNTISVSAPSYMPYSENIFLKSDATSINVKLSLSMVTPIILVYSEEKEPVAGASISIDGQTVGYTDAYGKAQLKSYIAGTYDITVKADDFAVHEGTVEFSRDIPTTTITLYYTSSTVTVKAVSSGTPVPDTVIYFDGDVKGMTNAAGVYTASVNPGNDLYISASHEGYTAESVTYTVKPGSDNIVIIELKQNVPVVMIGIGILALLVVIIIAVLVIGGKKRGRKSSRSPANSYPPTNKRDSL